MNVNISDAEIQGYISSVKLIISNRERFAYIYTFGCQQNEADSEKIRGLLVDMSYKITENPALADVIIINTCAVRRLAELKALSMLGNFKEFKRQKPELIVGVAGCMAAEEHIVDQLKKSFHYVNFTIEPGMLHKLPELILNALNEGKRSFIFKTGNTNITEGVAPIRQSKHKAWVSVMHGCNNFCSYCIVPYVRGRERSRDSKEIINECRELIANGYREITLLGQNVNSYCHDLDFSGLLESIANIEGDFIIRFMTSHPKDVPDSLISVMAKYSEKIAPHFHLPLQSGSDRILKAMNRTYNMEKYLTTLNKLREKIPGISLTSDIIVGFPGESDEDFEETMRALTEIRFDMVYSFIYSKREGTRAAEMANQVEKSIKTERMNRLLKVQTEISHQVNDEYVGREKRVLVDSFEQKGNERVYTARTATNKLVHFVAKDVKIGEFINVKITRAGAFDLFAEI